MLFAKYFSDRNVILTGFYLIKCNFFAPSAREGVIFSERGGGVTFFLDGFNFDLKKNFFFQKILWGKPDLEPGRLADCTCSAGDIEV